MDLDLVGVCVWLDTSLCLDGLAIIFFTFVLFCLVCLAVPFLAPLFFFFNFVSVIIVAFLVI